MAAAGGICPCVIAEDGDGEPLIGIARQECAVASSRAAVAYLRHPTVARDSETGRVLDLAPARQASGADLLSQERWTAHMCGIEVRAPAQEIRDRRQQSPVSVHVFERHVETEAIASRRIGGRASLHDAGVVIAPRGARHSEWLEDLRAREVGERAAAHALHDDREQVVPGVAVEVLAAGYEVE